MKSVVFVKKREILYRQLLKLAYQSVKYVTIDHKHSLYLYQSYL